LEEASKPEPVEPVEPVSGKPEVVESEPATAEAGRFIDIDAAAAMTGRTKSAIYNLTGKNKIPFTRERGKLSFEVAALEEWMKANPFRGRKPQNDETAKEDSTSKPEMVDINGASEILGRTPGAIRQHMATIPHTKVGNKLYFNPKELEKWAIEHPSRKRKKSNETETA
jgi:predicted DNA-binding transcriptional regulator AlpA